MDRAVVRGCLRGWLETSQQSTKTTPTETTRRNRTIWSLVIIINSKLVYMYERYVPWHSPLRCFDLLTFA